jgi:heme A synthase
MTLSRFAALTATATFFLLLLGGVVHNTRSSLACPDWPLCYGQFMPKMEGPVAIEHSHRLLAATVVFMTAALLLWMATRRQLMLGLLALGCVLAQALLGGITVLYRLPTVVSTAHLAVSQLFFCVLLYIALRNRVGAKKAAPIPRARKTTAVAFGLVYAQAILGALMRHLGAGLSCTDLPLCHGSFWPRGVPAQELHMLHRLFALAVLGHIVGMAVATFKAARGRPLERAMALAAPILCLVQIALGLVSVTSFLAVIPVTAHLAVAVLLLGDVFVLHLLARGPLGLSHPSTDGELVAVAS